MVSDEGRKDPTSEELQREKLQLEISELRHWWRRPTYIQGILSVTVAVIASTGTLVVGYVNGWFDVQRGRLEMQRSAVQRDIDQLTEKTDSLHRQIAGLEGEKHTLTGNLPMQTISFFRE